VARAMKFRSEESCSFCGKARSQVERLIAGPAVRICDECVALCNEILDEPPPPVSASPPRRPGLVARLLRRGPSTLHPVAAR